jgi:hypothetical protein
VRSRPALAACAAGSHEGVIAQLHLYFDDLFPTTLGKPVSQWGQ